MASELFIGEGLSPTLQQIAKTCELCQKNSSLKWNIASPGKQRHDNYSGEDWKLDFIHMVKSNESQYLLVWVDTFTNWIEAFPYRTENAKEMVTVWSQKSFTDLGLLRAFTVIMGL